MTELMSVVIRGVRYETVDEAAKKLKVSKAAVYSGLHRNRADRIGLGTGQKRPTNKGGKPKPITIGGITFPTLRAASLYLGYEMNSLSNVLRRGGAKAKADLMRRILEKQAELDKAAWKKRMK